jgi:hypothetical protein
MAALELCQPACFTGGVNLTKRKREPVCPDPAPIFLLGHAIKRQAGRP